jgi:acetoacetyl-CoA synthetase
VTSSADRGEVLRSVSADDWRTRLGDFIALSARHLPEQSYDALWRWSVEDLDGFWRQVIEFFNIDVGPFGAVLASEFMPRARWLPDARLSYSAHALRRSDEQEAIVGRSESGERSALTWSQLQDQVARCRSGLLELGVTAGDRIAAYAPNIPETIVAFLASASIGAIWVSCPPEFGTRAVVDRLAQVEPSVLIAADGYRYRRRALLRTDQIAEIRASVPSIKTVVGLTYVDRGMECDLTWADLTSAWAPLEHARVGFDHPLYVLFSSGTTGLPKAIVHGHGGILLEHHKILGLHNDIRTDDRFFWFSTTGWMMWNYSVSALLHGATVVCYDGDPAWPDLGVLWRLADEERLSYFGTSATYLLSCKRDGLRPSNISEFPELRGIGSTGSPLPADGFRWVYEHVRPDVLLSSASGGTDVCSAFIGGTPLRDVRAGELAAPMLGCDVKVFDQSGRPIIGSPGELVVTKPMPSMPVGFWSDADGSRFRSAYFNRFPGVWTHGDWITMFEDGASVVSGRSDATLNRGGVRLGTADLYGVLDDVADLVDSLVVHLEDPDGGAGGLILLAAADADADLVALERSVRERLRSDLSPRHVPDVVEWVRQLPRTLSGKRLEKPVKRLLQGEEPESVIDRGAITNPSAIDELIALRGQRLETKRS